MIYWHKQIEDSYLIKAVGKQQIKIWQHANRTSNILIWFCWSHIKEHILTYPHAIFYKKSMRKSRVSTVTLNCNFVYLLYHLF